MSKAKTTLEYIAYTAIAYIFFTVAFVLAGL